MRRGFTLIEILVVLAIASVVLAPFCMLTVMMYREMRHTAAEASLRTEQQALAARIFAAVERGGGGTITADNRGIRLRDGSMVAWSEESIWCGRRRINRLPVSDFAVVRSGGRLVVSFSLASPSAGRNRPWRQVPAVFRGPR